ncbi:MAG: SAM-dependent methyltransferase [Chitinophagaceae bacterium]|nr:SAM-dependent methyltransferase [Chitinophagaceae bacterium]
MSTPSIDWLFETETLRFLRDNEDKDPESFLLSKALANKGWDTRVLARQLKGIKTAKQKFPTFYHNAKILYPPAVSLEQASSEVTARFKASLVPANIVIDLSGGMGIDSYFFSLTCKELIYVEPQAELLQLAAHNFQALGATQVTCVNSTAAEFIAAHHTACDLFYIDPSRRKEGKRLASYKEWEPDIIGLKPQLFELAKHILIKLSPMTDVTEICKALGEVKEVFVVSDRNEVKEVLLLLEKNFKSEPLIHAVLLKGEEEKRYSFYTSEEQTAIPLYSVPLHYLYEPDGALLKAGAFKKIALDASVKKIHAHTHLYTSQELNADFLGKIFQVEEVRVYSKSNVEALIGATKAFHVLTRNAIITSEQVKKQHQLIERGNRYLLFFKGGDGATYVAKAERLK